MKIDHRGFELGAVDPHDVRVGRHMDIGIHAPAVAVWYLNGCSQDVRGPSSDRPQTSLPQHMRGTNP
jgi:hypothetical protein